MIYVLVPWRHQIGRNLDARDCVVRHYEHTFPDSVVRLCDDPEPGPFNRGRALNAGVVESHTQPGDVLVFADADLIVPTANLESAVRAVTEPGVASYVIPFDSILMTDDVSAARLTTLSKIAGPTVDLNIDLSGDTFDRLSTGGVNVMLRSSFDQAGGFDPRFAGWGFEDAAFEQAALTLVGPPSWITGRAVHLWHPSTRRPDTPEHEASLALCRRYEVASGNRVLMSQLIAEYKPKRRAADLARFKRETGS